MQRRRKALGLPWYGGQQWRAGLTMVERVRNEVRQTVAEAEAALPVEVLEATAVESLTPSQSLARVGLQGLRQLDQILSQPLDMENLKQQRLVGDLALGACRLWIRASEAEFRARRDDDALSRLLDAVRDAASKSDDKAIDG